MLGFLLAGLYCQVYLNANMARSYSVTSLRGCTRDVSGAGCANGDFARDLLGRAG